MHKLMMVKQKVKKIIFVDILRDDFQTAIYNWHLARGDKTLRLDYPLNAESMVIDAGGYLGDYAADIHCKFGCHVIIFEPIKQYYLAIVERFKYNNKIRVINAGLSDSTKKVKISVESAASSIYTKSSKTELATFISFAEFIDENLINSVDLLKINIEGGEYSLMKSIIQNDLHKNIKNIQIQYHKFIANAEQMRLDISNELQKSHTLMWDYPFVWESWRKK